jgi:hypothetical protein
MATVYRAVRAAQKKFFAPPDLGHSISKYDR